MADELFDDPLDVLASSKMSAAVISGGDELDESCAATAAAALVET
jgi:hypothetical protein